MPTRRACGTGIMCLRHSCRAARPKPVRSPGFISAPDVEALVCRALREVLRTDHETAQTGNIPGRRADIVALATDATIHIVEIKLSVADFRADTKWRDYRAHCDRLFFALPETVPIEIMPQDAGLILADSNGAEILREAPEHRMAAATQRAVLMRFAHGAAHRLHRLSDPEVLAAAARRGVVHLCTFLSLVSIFGNLSLVIYLW